MTPASQEGSAGSHSRAPTMASLPRGSFTTAERNPSNWERKRASRSAMLPWPSSGPKSDPPATTTRVGSPPVWESIILMRVGNLLHHGPHDGWHDGRHDSRRQRRACLHGLANDAQNLFPFRAHQGQPRSPHHLGTEAGLLHRQFYVLHQL